MDENLDQEVVPTNEEVEGENPESPEQPEEPSQLEQTPEEVEEEQPEEPAPAERTPSRRESLRIAKLVEKQMQQRLQQQPPAPSGMDYRNTIDAPDEVYQQLEADRRAVADQSLAAGLRQAENIQFHTRLEIDAPRVEAKYPQLNKEASEFDPVIADALNSHYLNLVGYDARTGTVQNPSLRYSDFIEAQYELAGALASERATKTSKNIAKQAATTGLRPDGSSTKRLNLNKAPEQMTDDELDAIIGQAIPKKR